MYNRHVKILRHATQAPRQRSRIPIPVLAKRGCGMAMIQLPLVCVALLSRKYCLKAECNLAAVRSGVQSAGPSSFCHFAHAPPTMPSISLVIVIFVTLPESVT